MKKVGVVTGARSEFGLLLSIIKGIRESKKMKLILYVTGMHLLREFGSTINEIKNFNFPNMRIIPMYDDKSSRSDFRYLGDSISNAVKNFVHSFQTDSPDIILLTGDRAEMLAAGIAAATLKLPIAHIHGGDIAENAQIDEQIRHALTKFSHLHFTATELSMKRVLQMGEEDWRVYCVGSPDIDAIIENDLLSKQDLYRQLGIANQFQDNEEFVLCVQHPAVAEAEKSGQYMQDTLTSLERLGKQVILIYPNNDPGSDLIIDEIKNKEDNPRFHIYRSLERKVYLSVMKYALFMIGNSSSGIIESATFHLPVVNIGIRNLNRETSENVINVSYDSESIWKEIQKAISPEFRQFCLQVKSKYGDGTASKKILQVLGNIEINYTLLDKKFVLR